MRVLIILAFFVSSLSVFAQTGSIRVTVYDDEYGEAMIGATVLITGTTTGNVSDLDGRALIGNLSPGNYSVTVSFVGFQTKTIESIEVTPGKVTALDVRLATESIGLEEVVITAEVEKRFESALLTVQKKSAKVLDAISSDMFVKNGDGDAAAAVSRVVGVTVQSGKYAIVRGLGDRYTKALLNGADIPSLDPNKNSVQLDLFPSNMIDNIIVYKTFTPDLPGEFSGGLVDITTKDLPDQFTFQAGFSFGFNTQATFNNGFLTYENGGTNFLGVDDGTRELPSILSGVGQADFPQRFVPGDELRLDSFSKAFSNTDFTPEETSRPFNHGFNVSFGDRKTIFGKDYGYLAGITYSRSFGHYDDGLVQRFDIVPSSAQTLEDLENSQVNSFNDVRSQDETTWAVIFNNTLKLNDRNEIGINLLHSQGSTDMARFQEGSSSNRTSVLDPDNIGRSRVLQFIERSLTNGQLRGEHAVGKNKPIQINWFTAYTSSSIDEPDLRFLQDDNILDDQGQPFDYIISNINRPGRFFRDLKETNSDSRLNIEVPVSIFSGLAGKFKFGGAYTYKDRVFREDRYIYTLRNTRFDGDIDALFTEDELGVDLSTSPGTPLTVLENTTQLPNNYDANQTIVAGYVMIETPITEQIRFTGGLRVENTDQDLTSFDVTRAGSYNTLDLLPSAGLTYEFIENTNLRVSYGRTLARPSFRESAPLVTFAFFGDNNQLGNPDLDRTTIDNYDLRIERFPRPSEYFGMSFFYKQFNNAIENTFNIEAGENVREFQYENIPQARIIGIEVEARKNLDFISPALQHFRVAVNGTYIRSEVDIEEGELTARRVYDPNTSSTRKFFGQSPFIINASLGYNNEQNGWSSTLAFNVFGDRLTYISADLLDIEERARPELNFTVKKQIDPRWSARFRANNLLNPDYKESFDFRGNDVIFNSYTRGVDLSFSVSYSVN